MDLILEPGRAEKNYWRDLWRYRELFIILAWRDISVRYKQTVIGVAWAVVRPLLTTLVFTVVFSKIGNVKPPPGVPFALFVMAANLPWQFFATAMSEASNSLIGNANLISKIYFPRLIIPAGSVITSFVDFLITLGLMGLMMAGYRFAPGWPLLALPLFMVLAFGAAFGIGLWLCALNVEYRDFRYIVPFIVQFGLIASVLIPGKGHLLYSLNPIVGIIDGFRWCILGGENVIYWPAFVVSVVGVTFMVITGLWYFRKTERILADII